MSNSDIQAKASADWGAFRKLISAHPLTGFWIGVAFGAIVVAGVLRTVF